MTPSQAESPSASEPIGDHREFGGPSRTTRTSSLFRDTQQPLGLLLNRARPRLAYPVRASPSPQLVRVAARSSRAGSGTTSCCGHGGKSANRLDSAVSLPVLWDSACGGVAFVSVKGREFGSANVMAHWIGGA
jgi:hypothetical protein